MYYQIENTPERIRRARRDENISKETPNEENPRLILAPFSRPPQVVFDNVLIGSSCERTLEVLNPLKQVQEITLGKALPPGLVIHLPGECLELEPETCYCLDMTWTPTQPTALRETIRFTNNNRGRFDVIITLKSVMNIKGKNDKPKGFKISPGKIKKKVTSKKSPVSINKKKAEIIYNTTKVKRTVNVVQSTMHTVYQTFDKENIRNDYATNSYQVKCPFDSSSSFDLNFDTADIFSNLKKTNVLHDTYEKPYTVSDNKFHVAHNVLRPSNKQNCDTATEIFDNLTFTPLKSLASKTDKLDKGPRIILSVNSGNDFDDSLDLKDSNKENQTHSIISITSSQPPNKWLTVNHTNVENQYMETPTLPNKKHPNTSSPKELNSPNFSINTDFSRISELSFFPQRFSTERKGFPKVNETQDMLDEKFSSDTYTKDSPNTPMDHNTIQPNMPPHYFNRDQPKMCRQSLFRDYQMQREAYDNNSLNIFDHNVRQNELRMDTKSPPRSIETPALLSIPEESTQFSDTQGLDKTNKKMSTFTLDRTFDRTRESLSTTTKPTWSKKAIRVEPNIWKVPVTEVKKSLKQKSVPKCKESIGSASSNVTFESNKSVYQNILVNQIGNIYSQSSTINPFLSATYFYDEEAVHKFENEFKRWLNCILTPPADLDSNVEQKIDVGKAWLENRNKEVPLAPTKEQVSSAYHNSHRLESLRRSARNLLMMPEMVLTFQKLNVQIEKKLIAIRTDRNLHLDVGLQKIIMEVLLSYNPLWLRIGLEAIYGLILPLKSNSDIDGMTTFIIQRMFKNPHLKKRHSKSSAPNMLLPAYMEAIKKFTLKKFFMLVFFLDQAKQRKLISHDPCLFCRNAICKESREIIIRFTREVIAGIGDITKHLRPLGYVVCHKQSYLDEYKYAVHNLALDIRDGVRLTKVMEIIMMKNGLTNQLRTPAISRLQKIHNVQVAMNALKEANFVIDGEITATDIADGHREKTLSLLWQIIHVFRAPLFEKAANFIQTWWRKKYTVIVQKKKEEERIRNRLKNAASVIQCWWRKIQYNREIEWRMTQITRATIVVQKYCRMWLCRTRLQRFKTSVLTIEEWFKSVQLMREAKCTLTRLKTERQQLRHKCATTIQSHVRCWLCVKHYKISMQRIVRVQNAVRGFLVRRRYIQLRKSVTYIQQKYKSKLLMRLEMQKLAKLRRSTILIQSYYRMMKHRKTFLDLKKSVQVLEVRYSALMKMRKEHMEYLKLKRTVTAMQSLYRGKKCRVEYLKHINSIILLQRRVRAHQIMMKERAHFLKIRNAAVVLQTYVRSYLTMKKVRETYISQKKFAILIQRYFRSYLLAKAQRHAYVQMRNASVVLQKHYRSLCLMRRERQAYLKLKNAALRIQSQYRAQVEMKKCKGSYSKLQAATLLIQHRYRALIKMRCQRSIYMKMKLSCKKIQNAYRAYITGKQQRTNYLKQKEAVVKIQDWYRNCKKGTEIKQHYQKSKEACETIQRYYKAYIIGRKVRREYIRIKTATICIQRVYRSYLEMKTIRQDYIKIKTSTVTIQRSYRSYLETTKQRKAYLMLKSAVLCIENCYRRHKEYQTIRQRYLQLREATITVQSRYRCITAMRQHRQEFLRLKQSVIMIQQKYRALILMRAERQSYLKLRHAIITIQTLYRAQYLMKRERLKYITSQQACISIQRSYKAYILGKKTRQAYLKLKESVIVVQRRYKALLAMRKEKTSYIEKKKAAIVIQRRLRANNLMCKTRQEYTRTLKACVTIQNAFRGYVAGKRQRIEYIKIKMSVMLIQTRYRMLIETRKLRKQYLQLKSTVTLIQRRFRANQLALSVRRNESARKIQTWYRSAKKRDTCRKEFLRIRKHVTTLQSTLRMYLLRKRYLEIRTATLTIQRYYRSYKLATKERQRYIDVRSSIITLQNYMRSYIARKRFLRLKTAVSTLQDAFRLKKQRDLLRKRRETAAILLQKHVRRFLIQMWYRRYRQTVLFVQQNWKGKLLTRLTRCEFLQKRTIVIKLQSAARGYLVRKEVELKKDHIMKLKVMQKRNWAASKIQALFRANKVRGETGDIRVRVLRQRWREGALDSNQQKLKERNEHALFTLGKISDFNSIIVAFQSLELLTEVYPMIYNENTRSVVRCIHVYLAATNRSISSVELLNSAAAVLVNLVRFKGTGPQSYARDHIPSILKIMWRYLKENLLFCKLATYLWLCSKYDEVKEDLTEFLHISDNHKMLVNIKGNIERLKRMTNNARSHKPELCRRSFYETSHPCPSLEPDFGIVRIDKPRYFEDAEQAINSLFHKFNL